MRVSTRTAKNMDELRNTFIIANDVNVSNWCFFADDIKQEFGLFALDENDKWYLNEEKTEVKKVIINYPVEILRRQE